MEHKNINEPLISNIIEEINDLRKMFVEKYIRDYMYEFKKYNIDAKKESWNHTIDRLNHLQESMIESFDLEESQNYITIAQYNEIYSLKNKNKKVDEYNCIQMLVIIQTYAKNRIEKALLTDKKIYKNIENQIKDGQFSVQVNEYLHQYHKDIEEYILENNPYDNLFSCINTINKNSKINLIKKDPMSIAVIGKTVEEAIKEYKIRNPQIEEDLIRQRINDSSNEIINKSLDSFSRTIGELTYVNERKFLYFDLMESGWYRRRKKGIHEIYETMVMIYIIVRCRELMNDFLFINQHHPIIDMNKEDNHYKEDISYNDISRKYYRLGKDLKQLNNGKFIAYRRVAEIKSRLLALYPRYTLEHIDMEQLNRLPRIIKDNELYDEIINIKEEFQYNQSIMCDKWDEFEGRLKKYSDNLSLGNSESVKQNLYYKTQLDDIISKLKKEINKPEHAVLISDLEKIEEEKVLKAEYEAMILVVKYLLTNETTKSEEVSNA